MIQFTFSISVTLLLLKQGLSIWVLFKEVAVSETRESAVKSTRRPVLCGRGCKERVYVCVCVCPSLPVYKGSHAVDVS